MPGPSYRIHPAIGIARVGNSEEYNIAPETMAGLPVPGDPKVVGGLPIRPGTESDHVTSKDLRDDNGGLKRQGARFRIFHYPGGQEEAYPSGKGSEVQIGTNVDGKIVKDIIWTVHLANKKANTFVLVETEDQPQGISGYEEGRLPPIRNWPTLAPDAAAPQPPDKLAVLNDATRVKRFTIDPGPRTVSGRNAPQVRFDRKTQASYYDAIRRAAVPVPNYPKSFPEDSFVDVDLPSGPIDTLGEIRTDEHGRLIVTGGYGRAAGWKVNGRTVPLDEDVNNDQWFDDSSDGPVMAALVFEDDTAADVHGAWVTATDPSFAPQILNVVSLWDDIYDAWVRKLDLAPAIYSNEFQQSYQPTFDDQVFPIFQAAALQQWTTNLSAQGRSAHDQVGSITGDTDPTSTLLSGISAIFRNPNNKDQFSDLTLMPLHLGGANESMLALRKTQYFFLEKWNSGQFKKGSGPAFGPGELLDKATFVNCLGGRFSPGIDLTFVVREPNLYIKDWRNSGGGPFRVWAKPLNYGAIVDGKPVLSGGYVPRHVEDGLEPGDLSKWMAIPWHTDYNSCATHPPSPNPPGNRTLFWSWPAQRPVAVFTAADVSIEIDPDTNQPAPELGDQRWSVRGLGTESALPQNWGRYQDNWQILENWNKIGTILQNTAIQSDGVTVGDENWFLETESLLIETSHPQVQPFPNYLETIFDERELFFRLMSDRSPDQETLKQARAYTNHWLKWAEDFSNDPAKAPQDQLFFPYTEDAFQERLDFIYQELVDDSNTSDPATNPVFKTRQDLIIRIIQFAPFNGTDGSWLRNVGKTGPIDEVRALIYSILMDELGDGDVSKNHCNIYLDLCHSVGFYPFPFNSREFAYDPRFLDSAFTVPAFELAISQFTDDYYPEILGMTLQLEWEIVDSKTTRDLFDYFNVNSHYYVMHIGIDNAVNGHGQRAVEAIKIYLQNARAMGGQQQVDQEWRRIWNGFVAFGNVGNLGEDLRRLIQHQPTLEQRMLDMIRRKAKYGSSNHQQHMVGGTYINEWFADPPGFLKALAEHGWITPGDWENSQIRSLMNFQTGPMYRVFTDDEIQLWADYTNSMGKVPPPVPPVISPARAMAALIDQLRPVQRGVLGHQQSVMADAKGEVHTMAWWFEQPTRAIMEALILPLNGLIVPGNPEASNYITELIAPTGPMGPVFNTDAEPPNSGTCREVAVRWVKSGCPLVDVLPLTLRLNALGSKRDRHPTGKILGMGAIH
ncbi:MAG TPA: LodA/GoxA family CTQ-dependent oxidase [Bryobacteraceae bacterium]|nr:LodA/GoxA family CTQ-dependent oxidase [Bryobacteraceae bacterium]